MDIIKTFSIEKLRLGIAAADRIGDYESAIILEAELQRRLNPAQML